MAELETSHVFNGNINKVFAGIGKFNRYPEFIPGVTSIQVLPSPAGSKAKCIVRYELNIVKTFYYTIEMFEEAPHRIWWTLVDSNLMKRNEGAGHCLSRGADRQMLFIN